MTYLYSALTTNGTLGQSCSGWVSEYESLVLYQFYKLRLHQIHLKKQKTLPFFNNKLTMAYSNIFTLYKVLTFVIFYNSIKYKYIV